MNLSIMIEILGSRFWKTSKRIRAVRKSEVKKGKRSLLSLNSSSDSDLDVTPNKRPKVVSMEERLRKLEVEMFSENKNLKESFEEKSKQLKDVKRQLFELRQSFECLICKSTVSFPAIVSPCCSIVIGCQGCIEQWLTSNPVCPHCRETTIIEECTKLPFIRTLKNLLHEPSQVSVSDLTNSTSSTLPIEVD